MQDLTVITSPAATRRDRSAARTLARELAAAAESLDATRNLTRAYQEAATTPDDDGAGVLAWQEWALCAQTDPEAFFPEKGGSTREAKRVCMACPVRVDCLNYALDGEERFGIWGGLSERERRRVKKKAV